MNWPAKAQWYLTSRSGRKNFQFIMAEIGVITLPSSSDFADQLSRNNSTPGHLAKTCREFQPYRLKYDGRSPYHILYSNHAINRNNNQPSPVRERHLLLRIDSMVLEPEKIHLLYHLCLVGLHARSGNHKTIFGGISGKGDEQSSFICRTPLNIDPAEPMAVENTFTESMVSIEST